MTRMSGGSGRSFLGQYSPGASLAHRLPVWSKYLIMAGVGLVPFFVANIWVSGAALAFSLVLLLWGAHLPPRTALALPWPLLAMLTALVIYHCAVTTPMRGVLYAVNVMTMVYLARLITATTTSNALMDAISRACHPLALVGGNPQKIALAFALMWRSIPYLCGLFGQVRQAARARGMRGFSPRLMIPAVVQAVGFGLATSDALKARGLDS